MGSARCGRGRDPGKHVRPAPAGEGRTHSAGHSHARAHPCSGLQVFSPEDAPSKLNVATTRKPWIVSDELGERLEPLLAQRVRGFRYVGRKPLPDREVLCGILYVLHTGIQLEYLPQELCCDGS